jgi:hypothetical protein
LYLAVPKIPNSSHLSDKFDTDATTGTLPAATAFKTVFGDCCAVGQYTGGCGCNECSE